jgi:hypothetical protein
VSKRKQASHKREQASKRMRKLTLRKRFEADAPPRPAGLPAPDGSAVNAVDPGSERRV